MPSRRAALLASLLVMVVACGTQETTDDAREPRPEVLLVTDEPHLLRPENVRTTPGTPVVVSSSGIFRVREQLDADRMRTLASRNDWGQRLALPVVAERTVGNVDWLRVRLPERPNGSVAWIRSNQVRTRRVDQRIVVDLSEHVLERWQGSRRLARFPVAVGAPSTPTTPGRFFVWAQVGYDNPAGAYGAFALGLSGFSEVITDWPGGGRMAIHGTIDPGHLGRDVSHGCVRVLNRQMLELRDVPLGTPVLIRP